MLDYIKQQIAERQKAAQPQTMTEADENDLIVEYAHLFQELDDLSVEGQDAYRDRSLELDIPIENDIELDTIEMNLMDGRITDIPMDAIVNQENFVESMKTYADFYLEACSVVQPFMREDAYNLEERRQSWAKKHYDVYHEQMVQEGLYGFDRMSMDDDHVPTNVMCDFGLLGSDDVQRYMVKSPVFFESADGEIVASQLTALTVAKNEHIFEQFADVLANKLNVNRNDVWDVATPTRVIVPVPKDEYHIIVEFDCENKNVPQYCGWKMSRKPSVRNNPIPENMYPSEASSQIVAAIPLMNKKDYVKESYVAPVVKMPSRWDQYEDVYQESVKSRLGGAAVGGAVASYVTSQVTGTVLGSFLGPVGAVIGGALGALVGVLGNAVISSKYDTFVDKGFIDDIDNVTKFLTQKADGVTPSNVKKLRKACVTMREECIDILNRMTSTASSNRKNSLFTIKTRHLSKNDIKMFTDLRDACGDVIASINVDKKNVDADALKNLVECMATVRKTLSGGKLNIDRKSSEQNDDDIKQESYMYQELTLIELLIAIAVVGAVGNIAGAIVFKKSTDEKIAKSVTNAINRAMKNIKIEADSVTVGNSGKLKNTCNDLVHVMSDSIIASSNSTKINSETIEAFRKLRNDCETVIGYIGNDNKNPSNTDIIKNFVKSANAVLECIVDIEKTKAKNKNIVNESYMYQEAIDFGYPDANTEAANKNQPADSPQGQQQQSNDNNPPELNEGGNDSSSPTIDAGGNDTPPEDNTPGEPATDTPPADEPKSPVETNDVSDQIAENISNQTTDNGADANGDISIDDDLGSDVGDDMNMDTPDASTPDSIDSDLNSLDSMGGSNTDDVPMGDPSTMDIDSMSIDDIMAQAAEKLKGMPIEQVKKFLSDGAGGLDDTSSTGLDDTGMQTESYYAQEAFLGIITKKNVKPELDEAIRGCLGVLNDSNKSLSEIIVGFKKAGKKLNKVLGKAIKMTDVFGTDQLTHLNKLNSALVKLQTGLKPTVSTDETNAVKAMIKNFTSEAVIVGKFLESPGQVTTQSTQKPDKTTDETVQESVFGKKAKEYLIWWLTGGVLRRGDNKPYNQLEFDTWTFLLQAVGGLLSFGFLNLYTDIRTFIRTHDMLNDNIDEIVATELTTDITKAVGFLAQDNSNTEIVGKLSKFKKALKDIIADAKYANKCKGALKDNVIKLSESASRLLDAVESFEKEKKNNGNASVDATLINNFMNACDVVINTCFDKNKLNAAIKDIKNKKDGE